MSALRETASVSSEGKPDEWGNTIAYVCHYCGWALTVYALWENGGVPYCCRSAERAMYALDGAE